MADMAGHKCKLSLSGQWPISVALIGAGGNGSQMLTGLAMLDRALRATGRAGLHVSTWDDDKVSEANVGRQLFYAQDVGLHKCIVLTHRLNAAFGLDWQAVPYRFVRQRRESNGSNPQIVVSCVDSIQARREVYAAITEQMHHTPAYWLDLGNDKSFGQVLLGELRTGLESAKSGAVIGDLSAFAKRISPYAFRLPHYFDVYPEALTGEVEESDTPSCSLAEALERQDLFINRAVTTFALELLSKLLRQGQIQHRGYYINLESGRVNPIPIVAQEVQHGDTAA